MKKLASLFLALTMALGAVSTAQADWGRRDWGGGGHHHHHHRGGGGWVGPAAVLAITGLAIGAAAYSRPYVEVAPAQPAYVAPPVYAAPPVSRGIWYFCQSSGQYDPYPTSCPEGWVSVPAR